MEGILPSDLEKLVVRPATIADVDTLHRFSVDLATYEDEPDAVGSTLRPWRATASARTRNSPP